MEKIQLLSGNITYNVYIADNVLVDTVPGELSEELLRRVDCSSLEAVIINHSEPDHSGALSEILKKNPDVKVIGTPGTLRNLREMLNTDFTSVTAKENGEYKNFKFKVMPGFPWPDSMVTYYMPEKILFSGNMFSEYNGSMEDFYKNEFLRSANNAGYAVSEISALKPEKICPAHGDDTEDVSEALQLYKRLGKAESSDTVSVIYFSKYGYTREMAEAVSEVLGKKEKVKLIDAKDPDAVSYINNSKAVCIGTNTIYRDMPECIGRLIMDADSRSVMGKPFMIFGSYGWSGEGMGTLYTILKAKKALLFEKPFRCIFKMSEEKKQELISFTERFLEFINKCEE